MKEIDLTLRPASDQDLGLYSVCHLELKAYVEAYWRWEDEEQEKLRRKYFNPDDVSVILLGDEEIGILDLKVSENEVFISSILLLARYQRKGLGETLMRRIMKAAKADGKTVGLRVLKNNPAKSLYERLGFVLMAEDEQKFHMSWSEKEAT